MFAFSDFVAKFPEFSAVQPATIAIWETEAYNAINRFSLGARIDDAAMLYVAHNLKLGALATAAALATGGTGAPSGTSVGGAVAPIQTKTVGNVTATYDTQAAAIPGAGQFNATSYGQRYWQLVQGAALGGLHFPGRPPFAGPWPSTGFGGFGGVF